MKCKQCGAELPEDAIFCSFCGAKQEADANEGAVQEAGPAKCRQCGAELPEDAIFCGICGAKQEADANEGADQKAEPARCKQCGAELPEDAVFCGFCGTKQEVLDSKGNAEKMLAVEKPVPRNTQGKAENSSILSEGTVYWRGFFSKDPTSGISEACKSRSLFWVLAVAANALLFSLALCNNIPQLASQGFGSLVDVLIECLKEIVPDGREIISGVGKLIPDMELPAIYSQFTLFALVSLSVFAVEAIVVYITLYALKLRQESVSMLLNVTSISLFPITAVSVLNLLLGLIYPPLTICTLIVAAFIHIVLLYEGIKKVSGANAPTIWQIGLTILVVCIGFMLAMRLAFTNSLSRFISDLASGAMDLADSVLGEVVSYLLDILEDVIY